MVELAINVEPQYELAICELYHPYFHGDLDMKTNKQKIIFITLTYVLILSKKMKYMMTIYSQPTIPDHGDSDKNEYGQK